MVKLVHVAEKVFRIISSEDPALSNGEQIMKLTVRQAMGVPPPELVQHSLDTQYGINNHYYQLIDDLVSRFFQLRVHHHAKKVNLSMHDKLIRKQATKLIIFAAQ